MPTPITSFISFTRTFATEAACIAHLEQLRWPSGVVSPYDAASPVYRCKHHRYRCKRTGRYFNVLTDTLFENTKVPLVKWFWAIHMVTAHKKGVSSCQLARDVEVTQKTAWFMLQRIRECFQQECVECLSSEVEADETYIGGKNKNKHQRKKSKGVTGRNTKEKTPVFGMVQRGGMVVAKVVSDVSSRTLLAEVWQRVKPDSFIYTDEWRSYLQLNIRYQHDVVLHGAGQYVNGKAHTNTIEGVWSLLKRGILGIYHSTSRRHLQRYVDEFVFRYNTRKIKDLSRFNLFLRGMHHRLRYKDLIQQPA